MENIDSIDRKILNIVQDNAKISHKEIAEKLCLSRTPIFERIRKMERLGIIQKYVALLNPKKLNRGLTVFCFVSLKEHGLANVVSFQETISSFPQVMEAFHIAGNFDFILKVMVGNIDDYQNFVLRQLSEIRNISQIQSSFTLNVLKYQLNYQL